MFKKYTISLLILLSGLTGYCQVTPQWKQLAGGILNYYPGKIPAGYDSLLYTNTLRGIFKLKADSVNNNGFVTHGYLNHYGLLRADTSSFLVTRNWLLNTPHTWTGTQTMNNGLAVNERGIIVNTSDPNLGLFVFNTINNDYTRVIPSGIAVVGSSGPTIRIQPDAINFNYPGAQTFLRTLLHTGSNNVIYFPDKSGNVALVGDTTGFGSAFYNKIQTNNIAASKADTSLSNLGSTDNKATARNNLQVKQSYIPTSANTTYTFTIRGAAAKLLTSSTYSNVGEPNKLVIFMHYYGGTVNNAPPNKMTDSLRANGYSIAQLSAGNSWGNETAQSLYGTLYQYLQQYYNFETSVYLVSESMGTLTALNIIDKKLFPIKSHVGITPVVNLYGYYNAAIGLSAGNTIQTAYNFTQSVDSCYKATFGYNPYQRIYTNFSDTSYNENNIPTYFAQGTTDPYIGWTRTLYKGALNTGRNYYMHEAAGFGHDTLLLTSSVLHNIMVWMKKSPNPSLARTPPAVIPQYYDAINKRWGWNGKPTAYTYEFLNTAISNRIFMETSNTSQFANNAIYMKLDNVAASNQSMDFQMVKNTAGALTGTSNFNIRSGNLFGTSFNYDWFEILNNGTASTLNLSAPANLILSTGYLAGSSGTSTGTPFLNAYGGASKTFLGAVFGAGVNALNGSGSNFQYKADIVPYTDLGFDLGKVSWRWNNVYANALQATSANLSSLTASKPVFTDVGKNLTSTGPGTSAQFIKGDGSVAGAAGSAILDFPSTAAQTSSELTITVNGAAEGDAVLVGVPNVSSSVNSCYTVWVSAANTVSVKFNNYSAGVIDPASGTFKVTVFK